MPYSSIKKKKCKHLGCEKYPVISGKGYCMQHIPQEVKEKLQSKRKEYQKRMTKNASISRNIHKAQKNDDLANWFKEKMDKSVRVCENCGASLKHYNASDWLGCQHHVLEKSLFHTTATNPLNHLVLGKWCCHSQWHTSMSNASKMPIFAKAKDIVIQLYPLLTQEEKRDSY